LKKLIFSLFFIVSIFGLEIVVDTTKGYSVLTMKNNSDFICKQKDNNSYLCKFFSLPSTPLFSTNTIAFKFTPFFKNNMFYLKIKVKNNSFLKSFTKNLYEGYNKRVINPTIAKKWVIVSYKESPPFLSNKKIKGLKFPLKLDNDIYVKAIDANGNPVDYDTQTADVIEYFSLLRKKSKDNLQINNIDDFLQLYPKSIFIPDVLYLKIKLLDEEGQGSELIKLANKWIKKFSFNEHLSEIILILAKNYANEGFMEDATYMYERLFTEYEGSKYAYEGMIFLADQLYSAGDNKRAFELYKKAFSETKDLEVATLAASRIAQRYMGEGKIKESVKYYKKIFTANKQFLLKDKQSAYELINQLADYKKYRLAIKIGKELFKKLNKEDNLYEPLIYRLAKWNYEQEEFEEAKKWMDNYINKFPFGDFISEIKDLKDKILFQVKDKNTTLMLKRYDTIISKYKNSKLADKALIKKVELLYNLKNYKPIINLSQELQNLKEFNKSILFNSLKWTIIKDFNISNCSEGIKLYKDFNISLSKKYDEQLFNCAYKVRDFKLATTIPNRYFLSNNNTILLKWLKNKEKIFKATNNYKKDALIIEDICNIETKCYQFKYQQFFDYYHLNNSQEFLRLASELSKKDNIKNIDIFMKVISYAKTNSNNLLTYTYGKKILTLQKKYKTYIHSPYIDFLVIKSTKKLNKKQEAINILKNLITLNIDDDNKARAYYMLSSLTNQKKYLKKCIELNNSKTWKKLCEDTLKF